MIKTQVEVTREFLKDSVISEEQIYRDLAHRLIKEMPFEALSKIIQFNKINPNDPNSENHLLNKELYIKLKNRELILFEARLDI